MRNRKHYLIIIVLTILILVCCTKKNNENKKTEIIYQDTIIENIDVDINDSENEKQIETEEEKDYVINWDDSAYNDKVTLEFSLHDSKDHTYCLYHNITKIEDVDFAQQKDVPYSNWSKIEYDDFSVTWNDANGAIVHIETISQKWQTKRGIRIGDSTDKVFEVYAPDSDIYIYNYEDEKYVIKEDKDENYLYLKQSNEGIVINAGNMIEEEMMGLVFYLSDGVVTNIEIRCGN